MINWNKTSQYYEALVTYIDHIENLLELVAIPVIAGLSGFVTLSTFCPDLGFKKQLLLSALQPANDLWKRKTKIHSIFAGTFQVETDLFQLSAKSRFRQLFFQSLVTFQN